MRKKICCVVQRYGEEINGGAEDYTRIYCEKLKFFYNVTAVATCAVDYQQWSNYYPPGKSELNGVTVFRFPVAKERDLDFSDKTTAILQNPNHTVQEALEWVEAQGPDSPQLVDFLKENADNFDLFIFFTYLYYPTVMGIDAVREKSVLVPFCHDEPYVYLKCYDQLFHAPKALVFNTEEERDFVHKRFDNKRIPSVLTGIGLDIPDDTGWCNPRERFKLKRPYVVYMGRVDESKGCKELFDWFLRYKMRRNDDIQLVLLGKPMMDIPKSREIVSLGFVPVEDKYAVLREAELLVLPSHFESLSIVVLEAFYFGKPVLVSGHCAVLKGHCLRSNGGLYFYGPEDFYDCLELMRENPALIEAMGKNGREYVRKNYQWEVILNRLITFLDQIMEATTQPAGETL